MKAQNNQLRIMHRGGRRQVGRARLLGKNGFKPKITAEQFRDARVFGGLTREEAADFLGVSVRTIGHWETGEARPAYSAFKLLRVYRHGDLIDPRWSAYKLIRGRLVTPENHTFEPADLGWLSLLVRRARALTDLLRVRDAAEALATDRDGKGDIRPRPAGVALALGLVPSETTQKRRPENPAVTGFGASCNGAMMGPQSGHEHTQAGHPETQSEAPCESAGRGQGTGGGDGGFAQRVPDLCGVRTGQADPAPAGPASFPTSPVRNKSRLQGRPERSVPVRQRPKGQAVPSRSLLKAGGVL